MVSTGPASHCSSVSMISHMGTDHMIEGVSPYFKSSLHCQSKGWLISVSRSAYLYSIVLADSLVHSLRRVLQQPDWYVSTDREGERGRERERGRDLRERGREGWRGTHISHSITCKILSLCSTCAKMTTIPVRIF